MPSASPRARPGLLQLPAALRLALLQQAGRPVSAAHCSLATLSAYFASRLLQKACACGVTVVLAVPSLCVRGCVRALGLDLACTDLATGGRDLHVAR